MKPRGQRRGGGTAATRSPREIRVRLSAARPAEGQPDVWVVNGRVIRFLDPSRPEDASGLERRHRLGGLLGALRPRHARRQGHGQG